MQKYIIDGISVPFDKNDSEIKSYAEAYIRRMGIPCSDYELEIYKKSIDARHRDDIKIVCSVSLGFLCEAEKYKDSLERVGARRVAEGNLEIKRGTEKTDKRPLIVGMGPCGMFCALLLAEQGYRPIIIDRGDNIDRRVSSVESFYSGAALDSESNIQFGAGGAGTFSDGKLLTRINDPLVSYVLEKLFEFGAPKDILSKAKPHIGTDKLRYVVKNLLEQIKNLGGEVIYRCRLENIAEKSDGTVIACTSNGTFECSCCVLALGHSARDTYKMLLENGFSVVAKPFSVGVRIEHRRESIERALYGKYAGHPSLGAAEYAFSDTKRERGVYTFCMCPGGEVVAAASEEGGVVVNGMSKYARDGENSNCALAVSVNLSDIEKIDGSDALGAIEFQRKIERAAFKEGGSDYSVPIQTVGDFLCQKEGTSPSGVRPTYMGGDRFRLSNMDRILPPFVTEYLRYGIASFDKKAHGFAADEALLSGAETRTSSPLRILRGQDMLAIGKKSIYPCGEGAGYAGGITSAAVDGIKAALAIIGRWA